MYCTKKVQDCCLHWTSYSWETLLLFLLSQLLSISSLSITSSCVNGRPGPGSQLTFSCQESALMHGSACITVSLKKPTHVPEEAWDVLLLFTVCPCGMNKRCASWWAEQCQWRNQRKGFKKTWMASSGRARCRWSHCSRRRHYPTASYNDHPPSPIRPWSSGFTVPVRSPMRWGINLICMLTNEGVM